MLLGSGVEVGFRRSLFSAPLNFAFAPGAVTMIFGANGIGKTTLLQTAAGLRKPLCGRIVFEGRSVTDFSPRERALRIAYVHSLDAELPMTDLRVNDVVRLGRSAHVPWWSWQTAPEDDAATAAALRSCMLESFAERPYAELSSGERQRVWVAAALATGAPVILLDEPASRLDLRYARDMLEILRTAARGGTTVIAAMHDVALAAIFADRAIVLHASGILADGAPGDVLTTRILSAAYDTGIIAEQREGTLWVRYA